MNSSASKRTLLYPGDVRCRDQEKETLLRVYRRISTQDVENASFTQLLMIDGATGIGKTSLALSLRHYVESDGGFFLHGKFDQHHGSKPNGAFSTAFAGLCSEVRARGEKTINQFKDRILERMGSDGSTLTRVIPELAPILGEAQEQHGTDERTMNSEAINQYKYLIHLFVRALSSPDQPIVLFMDDIHWADESSADLFWSLINDFTNNGILYVCCVRSDANNEIIDQQVSCLGRSVQLTKIHLNPLTYDSVNKILSAYLKTSENETKTLTNIVNLQTQGNCFLIHEYVTILFEEGLIQYDEKTGMWTWDDEEILVEFDGIRDLIQQRWNKLSVETQNLLKTAACLGSKLNLQLLKLIVQDSVDDIVSEACSRGFLASAHSKNTFEFCHDAIQDFVYNVIPSNDREKFHYHIGRTIWQGNTTEQMMNHDIIYDIVSQILLGRSHMKNGREKAAVAKLCLQAGVRAMRQSNFRMAFSYITEAIQLLGPNKWNENYHLCLSIHNFAAEVAYCTAKFDSVFHFVHEIFEHARDRTDTLPAQATHIYALGGSGRMEDAIETGLKVLKELGFDFPAKLNWWAVAAGFRKTARLLKGRSSESLLRLPALKDPTIIAAMHMLNLLFAYAFFTKIELAPFLAFKMVEITVKNGICPISCIGFGIYAMVLTTMGNDIDGGYKYGKLAMEMIGDSGAKTWLCRISASYFGCVHCWKRPIIESIEPLRRAYHVGLQCGDIEFAVVNATIIIFNQFSYVPLHKLDQELATFNGRSKFHGQEAILKTLNPFWQLIRNLCGDAFGDPKTLIGDIYNESNPDIDVVPTAYLWSFFYRMVLCYMVGDYDQGLIEAKGCKVLFSRPFGVGDTSIVIFFYALMNIEQASKVKNKRKYIVEIKKCHKQIAYWAKHSPLNFSGKQFLLEAELARLKGDHLSCPSKFTVAMAVSREAGMIIEMALVSEKAGRYYLSIDDKETGFRWLKESARLYSEWGAKLKVDCMTKEYGGDILLLN